MRLVCGSWGELARPNVNPSGKTAAIAELVRKRGVKCLDQLGISLHLFDVYPKMQEAKKVVTPRASCYNTDDEPKQTVSRQHEPWCLEPYLPPRNHLPRSDAGSWQRHRVFGESVV